MAESSPIPEQIEVAELLARKASGDLLAAQKLAPDPEINDDPIGFHAQQAVEKALKVGLTLQGADFPKTHDLDFLVTLSSKAGVEIQTGIGQAGQQTSDTTTHRSNRWTDRVPLRSPNSRSTGAMNCSPRQVPSLYAGFPAPIAQLDRATPS
jgi:HEPN domain-containing protein